MATVVGCLRVVLRRGHVISTKSNADALIQLTYACYDWSGLIFFSLLLWYVGVKGGAGVWVHV